ncbi:hypothetical protein ACW9UR_00600 [Halovulum sp. GXIMD14794]
MDRTQLTILVALAFLLAMAFGWMLRWGYDLLNPPPPPEPKDDSEWAEYARACEAARDEAQGRLSEVERELGNKLQQAQAELEAAMDGLGAQRRYATELEAELNALKAKG